MIEEILQKVQNHISGKVTEQTNMSENQIPSALQSVSSTVMAKAKELMDSGNIMELKELFTGNDQAKKEAFLSDVKRDISSSLSSSLGINEADANKFSDISIPEIIAVSKETLLGPDGKIGMNDIPRLMSFFKSGGKEAKGGFGGLFG